MIVSAEALEVADDTAIDVAATAVVAAAASAAFVDVAEAVVTFADVGRYEDTLAVVFVAIKCRKGVEKERSFGNCFSGTEDDAAPVVAAALVDAATVAVDAGIDGFAAVN